MKFNTHLKILLHLFFFFFLNRITSETYVENLYLTAPSPIVVPRNGIGIGLCK